MRVENKDPEGKRTLKLIAEALSSIESTGKWEAELSKDDLEPLIRFGIKKYLPTIEMRVEGEPKINLGIENNVVSMRVVGDLYHQLGLGSMDAVGAEMKFMNLPGSDTEIALCNPGVKVSGTGALVGAIAEKPLTNNLNRPNQTIKPLLSDSLGFFGLPLKDLSLHINGDKLAIKIATN